MPRPPVGPDKLVPISVLIYPETDARLRSISKRLRVSFGFIVRAALEKGLAAMLHDKGKEKV